MHNAKTMVCRILISALLGIGLLSLAVPTTNAFIGCKQRLALCAVQVDCDCSQDAICIICPDYTDIIPAACCSCA
jgi:hypothetical protein